MRPSPSLTPGPNRYSQASKELAAKCRALYEAAPDLMRYSDISRHVWGFRGLMVFIGKLGDVRRSSPTTPEKVSHTSNESQSKIVKNNLFYFIFTRRQNEHSRTSCAKPCKCYTSHSWPRRTT